MKKTKLVFISILLIGITGAITAQELNEKYMFSKNGSMVTKWVYRGIDTTIHSFPDIEIEITKKFWSKDHVYAISPEIIGKISLDTVKHLLAKKIPQKIARDSIRTPAFSYLFGNNSYKVRYFVVQKEVIKSTSEVKEQKLPIGIFFVLTFYYVICLFFIIFFSLGVDTSAFFKKMFLEKSLFYIIIISTIFFSISFYFLFSEKLTIIDSFIMSLILCVPLSIFFHLFYKKEQKKQKLEDSKNYDAIDAATLGCGKNEDFV